MKSNNSFFYLLFISVSFCIIFGISYHFYRSAPIEPITLLRLSYYAALNAALVLLWLLHTSRSFYRYVFGQQFKVLFGSERSLSWILGVLTLIITCGSIYYEIEFLRHQNLLIGYSVEKVIRLSFLAIISLDIIFLYLFLNKSLDAGAKKNAIASLLFVAVVLILTIWNISLQLASLFILILALWMYANYFIGTIQYKRYNLQLDDFNKFNNNLNSFFNKLNKKVLISAKVNICIAIFFGAIGSIVYFNMTGERWYWAILYVVFAFTFFAIMSYFLTVSFYKRLAVNTVGYILSQINTDHKNYELVHNFYNSFDLSQFKENGYYKILKEFYAYFGAILPPPLYSPKPQSLKPQKLPQSGKSEKPVQNQADFWGSDRMRPLQTDASFETGKESSKPIHEYYKFKELNIYSSTEWLADNKKKYRQVFFSSNASYIYAELSFFNKKFDEYDWDVFILLKCFRQDSSTEICSLHLNRKVSMSDNVVYFREGWGAKDPGYWKAGVYYWEAWVQGEKIFSKNFYIESDDDRSTSTPEQNLKIETLRLYEGSQKDTPAADRIYYNMFDAEKSRYIYLEITLKNLRKTHFWHCELFIKIYNAARELKGEIIRLQKIDPSEDVIVITAGWGSDSKGSWRADNYTFEVVFMDKMINSIPFTVSDHFDNIAIKSSHPGLSKEPYFGGSKAIIETIQTVTQKIAPGVRKAPVSSSLNGRSLIKLVYADDINQIASKLRIGLSIMIKCDKIMSDYLWMEILERAQMKYEVLEILDLEPNSTSLLMDQVRMLKSKVKSIPKDTVLIIPHLDLLAGGSNIYLGEGAREITQLLYRNIDSTILAFTDVSFEIPEILASRFSILKPIMGIPRSLDINGIVDSTASHMISEGELSYFKEFNADDLYRNISGMNPVKIRQAIIYAISERPDDELINMDQLISAIRIFKSKNSVNFIVPDVSFEEIGGYPEVKQKLEEAIVLIEGKNLDLEESERLELIPRGFIFYGPPGTGKTLFAKAVANRLNANVMIVSGPETIDMYVGESERKIREIFAEARRNAPSILIFDEFDSIASKRSERSDGASKVNNGVVAQILSEMDGFRPDSLVLVIGTTNRLDMIDDALLRPSRFQSIAVDLPDTDARKSIIRIYSEKFKIPISDALIETIVEATRGFNGDEIKAIFKQMKIEIKLKKLNMEHKYRKMGEIIGKTRHSMEKQQTSSSLQRQQEISRIPFSL